MTTVDLAALVAALGEDAVALPGSEPYTAATQAQNTTPTQAPAAVLVPRDTEETAAAVTAAGHAGARIVVQSTGHGAGQRLGDDAVLIGTRAMTGVHVDAAAATATCGSGCVWADVQPVAAESGLIALSGTAGGVGVCGFTFGGGIGWMVRRHGLTSGHLRAVRFVDGTGRIRLAAEDAKDPLDREALWAFRGGAPVGVATEVVLGLVDATDLAAGFVLWPGEHADALVAAWAERLESLPPTVTSTLGVRRLPPIGPFPDALKGQPVVHLSYASTAGVADLVALRDTLSAVAEPVLDTTGPADAARLAEIHGDPPFPVPSRGIGRWLAQPSPTRAAAVLRAARVADDDGLVMAELRHVATDVHAADGAATRPVGPVLLAAIGVAADPASRRGTEAGFARLQAAAASLDLGRGQQSFYTGTPTARDTHGPEEAERLRRIAATLDPEGRFGFERRPEGDAVAAA